MALYNSLVELKQSVAGVVSLETNTKIDAILADAAMEENRIDDLKKEFPAVYERQFTRRVNKK